MTSPAQPVAHEPFEVSITIPESLTGVSPDIDLTAGLVTIKYPPSIGIGLEPIRLASTIISGLPEGTYAVKVLEQEGSTSATSIEIAQGTVAVSPDPAPQAIYAFHNVATNHYFITASNVERDLVLSEEAGLDWVFGADSFNVWPAEGPAPTTALPVCRFYSSTVNSHFYTADAAECDSLKQAESGWTYEGIAFRALAPTAGSCAFGTEPVWRLFNNRASEQDSNHRFVTSGETYRSMIRNGWVGEGVAFCSPE